MPRVRSWIRSSPNQTFVLFPAAVLGHELVRRRGLPRVDVRFLPLLLWGFLQYRLCGRYRLRLAGGGRGLRGRPERLVTSGPYGLTRNPMYLGHLVFTAGLALSFRSPVGLVLLANRWLRFRRQVAEDERALAARFGDDYRVYALSVPRWLPSRAAPTPGRARDGRPSRSPST